MTNLHLIIPTITKFDLLERLHYLTGPDLTLSQSHLDSGPASIESEFDELLAGPATLINAVAAERSGADAIILACMGDPALHQVREAVAVPVLGPGETAMHYAAMCGRKFSIICTLEERAGTYLDHAKRYGLESKLASVRAAGLPVLEIDSDDALVERLVDRSLSAIANDKADVIILACVGFSYLNREVEKALTQEGYPAPVIDAMPLTLMTAATMAKVNLAHSKIAYPFPPAKKILGYGDFDNIDWGNLPR